MARAFSVKGVVVKVLSPTRNKVAPAESTQLNKEVWSNSGISPQALDGKLYVSVGKD